MGARLVKDISPAGSSSPNELISFNGFLFFSAEIEPEPETPNPSPDTQSSGGVGLMRSDGSDDGTNILKLFDSVSNLVQSGNILYFIAGVNNQYQLWSSDGTSRGTKQVKDLYPNADPNFPQDLFDIDGVLFYSAIDSAGDEGKYPYVNGYEVWRREGNAVGSRFFRNLIPDKIITGNDVIEEQEKVLDEDGIPIQVPTGKDGELEDQIRIIFKSSVTTTTFENDSFPQDFVGINGNYFFTAQSSSFYSLETRSDQTLIGGLELWFSDGTEAGTIPININSSTYTFYEPEDGDYYPAEITSDLDFGFKSASSSSFPRELTPAQNQLYFVANDGIAGFELWSITDQGTQPSLVSDLNPGNTSSSPEELTVVGKNLYFSADQGSGRKLFYYNKSFKKPKLVKNSGDNPESLTAVGKHLYYSAESELGRELWSAKKLNSKLVKDINPGSESSSPSDMTMVTRIIENKSKQRKNKYLYFTADDGFHGTEIMSVNLKTKKNKVSIDADVIDGPSSSFPRELTNHGQQLYFTAKNQSKGRELWTVGPSIQGPAGEPGASSSEINIIEKQTFVYNFSTTGSQKSRWEINGGDDASRFIINNSNGKLSFKSAPKYKKPKDQNEDNIYEVFVRSTIKNNGYDSDQLVRISVTDIDEDSESDNNNPVPGENDSALNQNNSSDEILFYTDQCGPITSNGPLYPCGQGDTTSDSDSDPAPVIGSDPDPITGPNPDPGSSNPIPTVTGNNLSADGKENYNNYNSNVDSYNQPDVEGFDDCAFASSARSWALNQLDENDDTLAAHYNQYFSPACDASQIII